MQEPLQNKMSAKDFFEKGLWRDEYAALQVELEEQTGKPNRFTREESLKMHRLIYDEVVSYINLRQHKITADQLTAEHTRIQRAMNEIRARVAKRSNVQM